MKPIKFIIYSIFSIIVLLEDCFFFHRYVQLNCFIMLGRLTPLNAFCYSRIYNVMITYICVRAHVHIDSSKKDKKGYFSPK